MEDKTKYAFEEAAKKAKYDNAYRDYRQKLADLTRIMNGEKTEDAEFEVVEPLKIENKKP